MKLLVLGCFIFSNHKFSHCERTELKNEALQTWRALNFLILPVAHSGAEGKWRYQYSSSLKKKSSWLG
jgi:hypothetical protein